MPQDDYAASLRANVSFLGRLLGEVMAAAEGADFLAAIERIRHLSRAAREGDDAARTGLLELLEGLPDDQLVPVARAFSQFLNLANIAEQRHHVSREMDAVFSASSVLDGCFADLERAAVGEAQVARAIADLSIELVLTAHPTEIMRRTLIHKHGEISQCLALLELSGHTPRELQRIHERLRDLLTQIWYGVDFREERPSPVDEARWGFAVVEESLWGAVPEFLRRLDNALRSHGHDALPLDAAPVRFAFWMGSDRDGNPNVTSRVTEEVLLLARWQAADLYLRDINTLIEELSMTCCTAALRQMAGDAREPYRAVLKPLRAMLRRTLVELERRLDGEVARSDGILEDVEQLWQPLLACYNAMTACGMRATADRGLLDLLRRVRCFGVFLVRFDIRQESGRHVSALDEITNCLGLGSYATWDEDVRREFLLGELATPRPLLPQHWEPSPETREVLDTCVLIGRQAPGALGYYVISMARQASDVLAVQVLLKACGCARLLPVAPLFETLDDLERAAAVMSTLLDEPGYRARIDNRQTVMIGYSDSSKDAGVLAAAWAQYRAQEAVLALCEARGVQLTLFHGRGGTIGRGGAPAFEALLSQPPGTLRHGLRVTEQGEMIRAKLGLTPLAVRTLSLYTSAIARANLLDPQPPQDGWRTVMDRLAERSCETYRAVVRHNPDFVRYFRHATPEQELGDLPLGSRPARRKADGGIESLRAIPWIFAWMQNRLMLPAWLGTGSALRDELAASGGDTLRQMAARWPFFATLLSMQGMVLIKADSGLSAYYDKRLVPGELRSIGEELRELLAQDARTLESLLREREFTPEQRWGMESIALRNIYTDPLNYLQVESLARKRHGGGAQIDLAVMVTIAGIAAGMRNTG